MTGPDGWELFVKVALAMFTVAGFDLGVAYLTRSQREAVSHD